jgi:predicted ATPase
MFITHLELTNWRNFQSAQISLAQCSYIIGPNASGKSNLLDVFRFLRDICKPAGGGLQKAIEDRGGISKLRCLHARRNSEIRLEIHFSENFEGQAPLWKYILGFNSPAKKSQPVLISYEEVWHKDERILSRPDRDDKNDERLLTETHLEQIRANKDFREIADFFGSVTYLHLVPQLLKFGDRIGGNLLENDPFGQGFLERIAKCQEKQRNFRLKKINNALSVAVPHFKELRFNKDEITGKPHLEALYGHHRPNAGWQREDQFSDGTLRLLGILWALLEGSSLLLIEEPELSLNEAVIEQLPALMEGINKNNRQGRQIFISSHSEALLNNKGIDGNSIVILEPTVEGTVARSINVSEKKGLEAGLSPADILLTKTRPEKIEQLGQMSLW